MTLPAVLARSPKGDAAIQGPPAPTLKRGDAGHTADLGRAPLDRRVASLLAMTAAWVLQSPGKAAAKPSKDGIRARTRRSRARRLRAVARNAAIHLGERLDHDNFSRSSRELQRSKRRPVGNGRNQRRAGAAACLPACRDACLAFAYFFFGMYRSVSVPAKASADMAKVSDSVGCGWMVRPMSSASQPISIASAASEMRSPASVPTMAQPIRRLRLLVPQRLGQALVAAERRASARSPPTGTPPCRI